MSTQDKYVLLCDISSFTRYEAENNKEKGQENDEEDKTAAQAPFTRQRGAEVLHDNNQAVSVHNSGTLPRSRDGASWVRKG